MPRRLISFDPGVSYHLYNRGVNRQEIFFENRNYMYFLFNIERYLLPAADLLGYCLMPNHYHLLIYIPETSEVLTTSEVTSTSEVSKAMMRLSVSYTKTINFHYDRVGPLFQGAFQAKTVDTDVYLSHLLGYIHLNPVTSGLVDSPEEWIYSSYHDYLDLDPFKLVHRKSFEGLEAFIDLGGPTNLGGRVNLRGHTESRL
jgi:REP element-mobilizing transposase RayT